MFSAAFFSFIWMLYRVLFDGSAWANIGSQLKLPKRTRRKERKSSRATSSLELLLFAKILCTGRSIFDSSMGMGHNDYVNKSNHINERKTPERGWKPKKNVTLCLFLLFLVCCFLSFLLVSRRWVELDGKIYRRETVQHTRTPTTVLSRQATAMLTSHE